ncbi:MAG: Fur family transcriptional regulator [Caldisericia bacterium]
MDHILDKLRKNGYRITKPREEILKLFSEAKGENLDASEIMERLIKAKVDIDMATLYRNLEILFSLKIIHKSNFTHQHAHYGLTTDREIHFVCKECGSISENSIDENSEIIKTINEMGDNFTVESVSIEAYGTCKRCRRNDT